MCLLGLGVVMKYMCVFAGADDEVQPAKPVPPPAMFVFGDGALDVGNNGYMPIVDTEEGSPPQVSR